MTTDVKLASEVSRDVELAAILLKSAKVASDVPASTGDLRLDLGQQYGGEFQGLEGGSLRVRVRLAFTARDAETGNECLTLEAVYDLRYTVPLESTYSDVSLKYFAELNGMLNVWPYWRELVHSVIARVGLGSLTLPVFRVKARELDEGETLAEAHSPSTSDVK